MTWTHDIIGTESQDGSVIRILIDYTDGQGGIQHDSLYVNASVYNLPWLQNQILIKLANLNAATAADIPTGTIDLTLPPPTVVPVLLYYVDGSTGFANIAAGQTVYLKTHLPFVLHLSGVDFFWANANAGDYLNFEVGVYTDPTDENTFIRLTQFGSKYHILGNGTKSFETSATSMLPSQYNGLDVYVRTTYVNNGSDTATFLINLIGWK